MELNTEEMDEQLPMSNKGSIVLDSTKVVPICSMLLLGHLVVLSNILWLQWKWDEPGMRQPPSH